MLPRGETIASSDAADSGPGFWTPCYHFSLSTMSPDDIIMLNHYNGKLPSLAQSATRTGARYGFGPS